jgi:hypothetical protein
MQDWGWGATLTFEASTTFSQNQLKPKIDAALSARRHQQLGGRSSDPPAMDADSAELRRGELAHLQIAKANHRDRLIAAGARARQSSLAQGRKQGDGMRIIGGKNRIHPIQLREGRSTGKRGSFQDEADH